MASIIVSNLSKTSDNDEIRDFFSFGSKSGTVQEITPLDLQHDTKTVRINFDSSDPISNALLLNGTDFKGTTLRVVEESGGIKSKVIAEAT